MDSFHCQPETEQATCSASARILVCQWSLQLCYQQGNLCRRLCGTWWNWTGWFAPWVSQTVSNAASYSSLLEQHNVITLSPQGSTTVTLCLPNSTLEPLPRPQNCVCSLAYLSALDIETTSYQHFIGYPTDPG